jgi:hypothetical protein
MRRALGARVRLRPTAPGDIERVSDSGRVYRALAGADEIGDRPEQVDVMRVEL